MNATPAFQDLLTGGFGALLGPGLALPVLTVFLAGLVFAPVRRRSGHLATAAVLVLIFSTASTTRGLAPSTDGGWLVSLAILVVLSWWVVRKEEGAIPWLGLASGLLLATLAIQWRSDTYGPLLGSLRGEWQSSPDHARIFVYHLATATALGGLYLIGTEFGRRIPSRWGIGLWWAFSLGAGALMATSGWNALVRQLLLRWPGLPVG